MSTTRRMEFNPTARDLMQRALAWMDAAWDAEAGLFRMPGDQLYEAGNLGVPGHMIRETAWYALGLLARGAEDDVARARQAIRTVLTFQFDAPTEPYHGTWYRSPYEPHPPPEPTVWRDYDPNWREFIGTTLALVLIEFEALLDDALRAQIDVALRRAIDGTIARDVPASYTNIALMTAFLLQFGAARFDEPSWAAHAERLAREIVARYDAHDAFDEYNSPTYYGVDLYALALWRKHATLPFLREAGARIEHALWRDIAQFYHAELCNVAGPYDRSYGMDMRKYVAGLGIWIWLATGYARAPFPDLEQPLEHGWDFAVAPVFALLGLNMPEDVQAHFMSFQGERLITRMITAEPHRVASAWVGARLMLGAEDSSSTHRINSQYHPVTIHWLQPDAQLGWVRLRHTEAVDARAERNRLSFSCAQHQGGVLRFVFQVASPGAQPEQFAHDVWMLPGLRVQVATNASELHTEAKDGLIEVHYSTSDLAPGLPVWFQLDVAST